MKKQVIYTLLYSSFLFLGCMEKAPLLNEITGHWVTADSAVLDLRIDKTFNGKNLPAEYFTNWGINKDTIRSKKVSGAGKWDLAEGKRKWEIKLDFEQRSNVKMFGRSTVLLAREGQLERGNTWYIFLWVDEPGGDRYKFEKQ